ncbi:MAG: MCP four helix bundle domain-containing protein [Methylococcales bacterium]|jgi:hypothetical protein|nr:MCP four helix bundle domain-containing protein [Methylococcales bacterium]
MKLKTKVITSFCIVFLIGLMISIIGMVAMGSIDGYINKLYHQNLLSLSYIKEAQNNRSEARHSWNDCLISQSPEDKRKYADLVGKHITAFKNNLKEGEALYDNEQTSVINSEISAITVEWENLTQQMLLIILQQNLMQMTTDLNDIYKKQSALDILIDKKMNALNNLKQKSAFQTLSESNNIYKQNLILMIALISVGFIISISIGRFQASCRLDVKF